METNKKGYNDITFPYLLDIAAKKLPDGELNPGLPRDRRGYWPLYYRGLDEYCPIHFGFKFLNWYFK